MLLLGAGSRTLGWPLSPLLHGMQFTQEAGPVPTYCKRRGTGRSGIAPIVKTHSRNSSLTQTLEVTTSCASPCIKLTFTLKLCPGPSGKIEGHVRVMVFPELRRAYTRRPLHLNGDVWKLEALWCVDHAASEPGFLGWGWQRLFRSSGYGLIQWTGEQGCLGPGVFWILDLPRW